MAFSWRHKPASITPIRIFLFHQKTGNLKFLNVGTRWRYMLPNKGSEFSWKNCHHKYFQQTFIAYGIKVTGMGKQTIEMIFLITIIPLYVTLHCLLNNSI